MSYDRGYEYGGGYGSGGFSYGGGGFDAMGGLGNDIFGNQGGGFMPDVGSSTSTPDKKSRDRNSIIPLSLKQLNGANFESDTLSVDGHELIVVKVMGFIDSIEEHSTNVSYRLNDGTGIADCKYWISKGTGINATLSQIRKHSHVKIFANPRENDGRRELLIYDISLVEDPNEVTHHLLDIILCHLQHTKGPLQGPTSSSIVPPIGEPNRLFQHNTPLKLSAVTGKGDNLIRTHIVDAFRGSKTFGDSGVSTREVLTILNARGHKYPPGQIAKLINDLNEDGTLYSTIEDHYKLTEE